jgi:hypothetical protein
MPECKNCKRHFPNKFKDADGKQHNCQRRKYCFECSPYNNHNTSRIHIVNKDGYGNRICKCCGESFDSKRRYVCFACNVNKQRQNKKDFLVSLVGNKCWHCGYGGDDKYIPTLDMHHVNENEKLFGLNISEISQRSKYEIIEEAKKCVLLCSRCHREYHHTDLITDDDIKKLHLKWKDISIPG